MAHRQWLAALLLALAGSPAIAESFGRAFEFGVPIVPESGYEWGDPKRSYWPTEEWLVGSVSEHGFDETRLRAAIDSARQDELMRAVLIVRDGRLVVEEYFNDGAPEQSTEVWSVTKSVVSAMIGIALQQGHIESIDDPMTRYLPGYPEFGDLTIRHVLTHTTGLEWTEEGDDFVAWLASPDPVANAVRRERLHKAGEELLYGSGNSHFLSVLILNATGMTPGDFAHTHMFEPLGIKFASMNAPPADISWNGFLVRTPNTWKQVSNGIELGAFGLSLTARDMARFGYLFLNKGAWDGKEIISKGWVIESTRDHVRRSENFGFGYHWVVSRRGGHLAFNADGWGGQIICIVPSLDMVVVLKSDAENPGSHGYYEILGALIDSASPL